MERAYHETEAKYMLPNDATEHERLELQGRAITAMLHSQPNQAPVSDPRKILEVGCGTGHMAVHMARAFGSTVQQIIGVDLSPVPKHADLPETVTFLQGDFHDLAKDRSRLVPASFDYVFSRMLVFGMVDWPGYIATAKDLLAPGGWLELQEVDFIWYDQNKTHISESWKWLRDQSAAWNERGLDMRCASKLGDRLRAAGFVDVQVKEYRWVFGHWKGHPETDLIGRYSCKYLPDANFGAYKKVFAASKTPEEIATDEREMMDTLAWSEDGKHFPYFVAYGKKPA